MKVRRAVLSDFNNIATLAETTNPDTRYARYRVDCAKIWALVQASVWHPDDCILLVAYDPEGNLTGFLLGLVAEHYTHDLIQLISGALVAVRGTRACATLVREFVRTGRELGVDEVVLGRTNGARLTNRIFTFE